MPTRAPAAVDRRTASWAMTLAPVVGALLALAVGTFALLTARGGGPLLVAALTVGLLALATRALHLDGLADTADGLGSARAAADAREVMRRSDIGPFGVATLVLVLLVQVAALAHLVASGTGVFALATALIFSRLELAVICSRGVASARTEGLGHTVAGSVSRRQLVASAAVSGVLVTVFALLLETLPLGDASPVATTCAAVLLGLLVGTAFCWHCVRRFAGITGDVMGATLETTFTTILVAFAVLA